VFIESCRCFATTRVHLRFPCFFCPSATAADRLVNIDTRPGVRVGYWWMERPDATATVVLLPGGKGAIGMKDGVPTSDNFLVRNRERFAAAKFNVAVVGERRRRGLAADRRPAEARHGQAGVARGNQPRHAARARAVVGGRPRECAGEARRPGDGPAVR
jgi:hypothetical protein